MNHDPRTGMSLLDEWFGDLPLAEKAVANQLGPITRPDSKSYAKGE